MGSRVVVTASVDDQGLAWLMHRRGWPRLVAQDPGVHRIGLLVSKSGPNAVNSIACEYLAQMAVDEINSDGGLRGKRAELLVVDDATDPHRAFVESRHLLAAGCRAIIASVTSASFAAACQGVGASGIPIIQPHLNEGGPETTSVFRWGERPLAQVRALAQVAMESAGGRRWYLIGNDYCWSHAAHRDSKRVISEAGGHVIASTFARLGTLDFSRVVEDIERKGTEIVLSTLVGADEVAFQRQAHSAGIRSRCETVSLTMEEATRERVGDAAATGIWVAFSYFQSLDDREGDELSSRYRAQFGQLAPPISSFSHAVYEALMSYSAAARRCRNDDPISVANQLHAPRERIARRSVASPPPDFAHPGTLQVGQARIGGFALVDPAPPGRTTRGRARRSSSPLRAL
ncbi:ABC transporter substrate-binding protein [Nocardioides endophyticus]